MQQLDKIKIQYKSVEFSDASFLACAVLALQDNVEWNTTVLASGIFLVI
jgi:hypothetical protein